MFSLWTKAHKHGGQDYVWVVSNLLAKLMVSDGEVVVNGSEVLSSDVAHVEMCSQ
jgi:hypothetical protein